MARSNIYVTFGYVFLILTILAGIAVGLYYLITYLTSPIIIDDIWGSKSDSGPGTGLSQTFLNIIFHKTGECINCTPILNYAYIYDQDGNIVGTGTSFGNIVSTEPKTWRATILIPENIPIGSYIAKTSIKVSDSTSVVSNPISVIQNY